MTYPPESDLGEILITADQIQERVVALGREITRDCADSVPLLVGILKGSILFTADLMRAIDGPVEIDFMAVSSYGDATKSSGIVRIVKDLDAPVAGRHVILVEDIIDSGLTMTYLLEHLLAQGPASVRTCSLLVREGQQAPRVQLDYVGFRIPPAFVIGYGLDVAQCYRNLPYIGVYTGS
jgi:hypoxanthine phosphoribosyltransferase